jgi:hypothetical protein
VTFPDAIAEIHVVETFAYMFRTPDTLAGTPRRRR